VHLQRNLVEVAIQSPQHGLVSHDAHTLTFPLNLDDDGLQALNDIQVTLPTWVPAHHTKIIKGCTRVSGTLSSWLFNFCCVIVACFGNGLQQLGMGVVGQQAAHMLQRGQRKKKEEEKKEEEAEKGKG